MIHLSVAQYVAIVLCAVAAGMNGADAWQELSSGGSMVGSVPELVTVVMMFTACAVVGRRCWRGQAT